MPHQVTVTAKTGPDRQVTASIIPNVENVEFDLTQNTRVLRVVAEPETVREFDLTGVTVVTCAISGGNFSFTVS